VAHPYDDFATFKTQILLPSKSKRLAQRQDGMDRLIAVEDRILLRRLKDKSDLPECEVVVDTVPFMDP
jgi:hypothetical protein